MINGIFVYSLIIFINWNYCIHYLQSQPRRYAIIRHSLFRNSIKISYILTDRCGIKPTGSSQIYLLCIDPILRIFGTRLFYYIIKKKYISPYFNTSIHRVTDMFGKKKISHMHWCSHIWCLDA